MSSDDDHTIMDNFAPTEIIPGLATPQTMQIPRVEDDEPVTEFFGPVPHLPGDPYTAPDLPVCQPANGQGGSSRPGTWRGAFYDLTHDPDGVFYLLFILASAAIVFWWTLVSFKPEWVPPAINPRPVVHTPSSEPSVQPSVRVPARQPKATYDRDPRPVRTHRRPVAPVPSGTISGAPGPSLSPSPEPSSPEPSPSPGSETPTPVGTPTPTGTQGQGDSRGPGATEGPVSQRPQPPASPSASVVPTAEDPTPSPEPSGGVTSSEEPSLWPSPDS